MYELNNCSISGLKDGITTVLAQRIDRALPITNDIRWIEMGKLHESRTVLFVYELGGT